MGKGSGQRPRQISREKWEENWGRIFGKKKKMVGTDRVVKKPTK